MKTATQEGKRLDTYARRIIGWTCLGLLLRLVLMPFTMHGQDLQFINYFPMMFVTQGAWDPYKFGSLYLPNCFIYYGPAFFFIMAVVYFIYIKVLGLAFLVSFLAKTGTMLCANMVTADYVRAFTCGTLYKTLFFLKLPYLIFDFLIAWMLLKISRDDAGCSVKTYALWMFNIVVLHSSYACGQFEVVAAFFIIAALYAALRKRPYLCLGLLGVGGAVKTFPYILVLPAVLLLGDTWKKRFLLASAAGLVSVVFYLPFYFSSGNLIFGSLMLGRHYSGAAKWILYVVFAVLYCLLLAGATRDSERPDPQKKLVFYFLAVGFLVFAATPIGFRYFVFITPLLALVMPGRRKFSIFVIFAVMLLAFLMLSPRSLQFGLLAPLSPDYFDSLPALEEIIGRFINIEIAYKIGARLMVLVFFACAWWVWQIKNRSREAEANLKKEHL